MTPGGRGKVLGLGAAVVTVTCGVAVRDGGESILLPTHRAEAGFSVVEGTELGQGAGCRQNDSQESFNSSEEPTENTGEPGGTPDDQRTWKEM